MMVNHQSDETHALGTRSARPDSGGYLALIVGATLAGATAAASAGILDFESLPEPTILNQSGLIYKAPVSTYSGFRFSSYNYINPWDDPPSGQFAAKWGVYRMGPNPQPDSFGYAYGINGDRALYTPIGSTFPDVAFHIEREDGADWLFGGAQFTSVQTQPAGCIFRIVGKHDGIEVFNITSELSRTQQTFVGADAASIAVDKITVTYHWPDGAQYRWWTMDDMHYELVPSPGAIVLLPLCGLMRRRRQA